jgi:hypothetical protein
VSRAAAAVLAALAIAGCGRERLATPDVDHPIITGHTTPLQYPKAGVEFQAPTGWSFGAGPSPLVTQSSSGSASIAVWRYDRTEPLPRTDTALASARETLLSAVRGRDDKYAESQTRDTKVDGAPAIQLLGDERVAGQPRRVRSTHVYAKGAEYVIDLYAAPADFGRVDEAIFQPLLESFKIDPPTG